MFVNRLKRAGMSARLPLFVQLDLVRRSPEACRSVVQLDLVRRSLAACRPARRASLYRSARFLYVDRLKRVGISAGLSFLRAPCYSAVRLDTRLAPSFLVVVSQKNRQSCGPTQAVVMRYVLHANGAQNLL